jgi:DNA-binding NarL/FixJ family response regulator
MSDAKSILLIDGHDKDRTYYAHRLKVSSPDHTIFEAATGEAGLALYSQSIDCVILELGLPDMSGFDVLCRLVPIGRRPEVPVIVLTTFTHGPLLKVAGMNGAFAVLQKHTTSGDELDQVVRKAMATIPRDVKKEAAAISSDPFLKVRNF